MRIILIEELKLKLFKIISLVILAGVLNGIIQVYGMPKGWYPGSSGTRTNNIPTYRRDKYNDTRTRTVWHEQNQETLENSLAFYSPLAALALVLSGLTIYIIKKRNKKTR